MAARRSATPNGNTTKTGVTMAELMGGSRQLDVVFPTGRILHVVYNPAPLTHKRLKEVGTDVEKNIALLCELLDEWDLEDKQGPIPITPDEVSSRVTLPVMQTIFGALTTDQTQVPQTTTIP